MLQNPKINTQRPTNKLNTSPKTNDVQINQPSTSASKNKQTTLNTTSVEDNAKILMDEQQKTMNRIINLENQKDEVRSNQLYKDVLEISPENTQSKFQEPKKRHRRCRLIIGTGEGDHHFTGRNDTKKKIWLTPKPGLMSWILSG
ncbi:hypothetical protein JTB14_026086 [Gonioctena quinquepunctata]|nr:hypothetical protein JTB14_026086 [Gonioctena quinquepunctata]